MKKAKILIPSISLLCFSAIACVTGSVAWFSSVSNASVGTTNFAVKALDGSMNVEVYHGVGTVATLANATTEQTIKDGSGNIIGYKGSSDIVVQPDKYGTEDPKSSNQLTHGSYDAGAKKAYSLKPFSSTDNPDYEEIATGKDATKANESSFWASGTEGCYHIFSFDLAFKYDFGGAAVGKYNLFFDVDSSCTRTTQVQSGLDTAKGFRMAFINTDSNDWVVWSKLQGATWGTAPNTVKSKYVGIPSGSSEIRTKEYDPAANGDLIYDGDTSITHITTSTGSAARKDCLGTFDAQSSKDTIKVRVIAWYEGEDPNVVKTSTMNAVSCALKFYLKGYAA